MKHVSLLTRFLFNRAKLVSYFDGTEYDLEEKCRLQCSDSIFAVFEKISRNGNTVHVNHFSVEHRYRGCDIGANCLRKFACHLAQLDPAIDVIQFELYKGPTNANHAAIADARFDLLQRIGAVGVIKRAEKEGRYTVMGTWHCKDW